MPLITQFWRPTTGMFHAGGPGIEVATGHTNPMGWFTAGGLAPAPFPATFQGEVHDALTYLNATPSGSALLWELHTNGNGVGITPSLAGGNSASMNNGANSLNLVAQEILGGGPGVNTNAAVTTTFGGVGFAFSLANRINTTPRWDLNTVPGVGGGFWGNAQRVRDYVNRWSLLVDPRYFRWSDTNEGYSRNQSWFGGDWGVNSGNPGITGGQVAAWLGGAGLPLGMPAADQEHVKVATIAAVYANSPRGLGTSVGVRWFTDPNGQLNQQRPPVIGLAHELVHAYYGMRGEQPGHEIGHYSTVLFEYLCVGLGPWDGHAPTENSLRQEWWPHASPLIPTTDNLNRKVPPRRIMYN